MELWIRSQDRKTLTKVKEIYLNYNDTTQILCNQYMFGEQYEGYTKLGKYKTEERALEILDEIQKTLQPKLINYISPTDELVELVGGRGFGKTMEMKQDIEIKELSTYVYEMPIN